MLHTPPHKSLWRKIKEKNKRIKGSYTFLELNLRTLPELSKRDNYTSITIWRGKKRTSGRRGDHSGVWCRQKKAGAYTTVASASCYCEFLSHSASSDNNTPQTRRASFTDAKKQNLHALSYTSATIKEAEGLAEGSAAPCEEQTKRL